MKVRATISFSGLISMYAGEVREVEDSYILNDLMRAGYVVPAEAESGNPQTNSDSEGEGVLLEGTLDTEELEGMTVPALRALAKQMGLDDAGKKADLIERISAAKVAVDAEGCDSDEALGGKRREPDSFRKN